MIYLRIFLFVCIAAGFFFTVESVMGESYPVILRGKVVMPDGTPPPTAVALERVCSDGQGSRPGPLTNKKGEYIWRMDVDPMRSRSCVIRATHAGYESTEIDISALHGYLDTNIHLKPIVISARSADPYAIFIRESGVPGRARTEIKAAMKALDNGDHIEALRQFQSAVEKEPKFALGWHALGVLSEFQGKPTEALEAYERAIECNPKLLSARMTLLRLRIKNKDWQEAARNADLLIRADRKKEYPDAHLHRAVALYGLKNLPEAAASAREAISLDPHSSRPRAEYVLGRILEAQGEIDEARKHMLKYLELDTNAPDADLIRKHIEQLGKPGSEAADPELEYL